MAAPVPAVDPPAAFSLETAGLGADDLAAMAAAGDEILEVYRVLQKTGDNVVGELLRGEGTFYELQHYPKGDVYDQETASQYYYHAHPYGERGEEHGHFHTFLRPKGMPEGVAPAPLADYAPPDDANDALSHLAAISMTPAGFPFRLFTTNRWVTAETWYPAGDVVRMLDCFEIDHAQPSWPVNRWVTFMVRLFKPQIAWLLHARDRALAEALARRPGENAYEDRDLEVTSSIDIDVAYQVTWAREALER